MITINGVQTGSPGVGDRLEISADSDLTLVIKSDGKSNIELHLGKGRNDLSMTSIGGIISGSVVMGGSSKTVLHGNVDKFVGSSLEVHGNVDTVFNAASVEVHGDIGGNVAAGSSVECGNVNGDVHAGSSVECGTVGGNVEAGSSVDCCQQKHNKKRGW